MMIKTNKCRTEYVNGYIEYLKDKSKEKLEKIQKLDNELPE